MTKINFKRKVPGYCCQYCGDPVGYVGRFLAWIFGLRIHGCNHRNVKPPA